MHHHRLGRLGEWIALGVLLAKGHRPRHRNWRGAGGELDIVATHRGAIVFVEVKTRSGDHFGGAGGAVGRRKQQQLIRVAAAYLSRFGLWQQPCRFDIVTVERQERFPFWSVHHYPNAFDADLGRQM